MNNPGELTALENLASIICQSVGATLVAIRAGQVLFSLNTPGKLRIESLPLEHFNSQNVRAALRQYQIEKTESR